MPKLFQDAGHILRLVGLFAVGAFLFLVVRAILIPAGFGDLGHFRSGAIDDNAARAPVHAGRRTCAECHAEEAREVRGDRHAHLSCEGCHGPLAAHAADPVAAPASRPADSVPICSRCHAALGARPPDHPQVDVAEHAEGAECIDCHAQHAPSI